MKPRPNRPLEWDYADGFHVVLRLADNKPLVTNAAERRVLARVMHERTFFCEVLAFRVVETHLHVVARGLPEEIAAFAQFTGSALHWRLQLTARFQPYAVEPLFTRRALVDAVRHVFMHERERGLEIDPAHDGSCLVDLIGARAFRPPVVRNVFLRTFPECTVEQLVRLAAPAGGGVVEPSFLAEATLSAAALPSFGRDAESRAALRAAVHVWDGTTAETAGLLGVDPTSVRRWRDAKPETRLVDAIRRQLEMRASIAAAFSRTGFDPFPR